MEEDELGLNFQAQLTIIDLVDTRAEDGISLVDRFFGDPKTQHSMLRSFERWRRDDSIRLYAGALSGQLTRPQLQDSLLGLGEDLADNALDGAGRMGFRLLQESPIGRSVTQRLNDIKETWERSPTGLWVDRNRNKLYIAGGLLTAAGVGWMFREKKPLPEFASSAINKLISDDKAKVHVGSFDIGLERLTLRPETRTWGADIAAQGNIAEAPTEFSFKFEAMESRLQYWEVGGRTQIPLGWDTTLTARGGVGQGLPGEADDGGQLRYNYMLDLRRDLTEGPSRLATSIMLKGDDQLGPQGSVGLLYRDRDSKWTAGLYGSADREQQSLMLGLNVSF